MFDLNLVQVVQSSIHIKGNTLDLIFTNSDDCISELKVLKDNKFTSDHYISLCINTTKPYVSYEAG